MTRGLSRSIVRLLRSATAVAAMWVPTQTQAQQTEYRVHCSEVGTPNDGIWAIVHNSRTWWFDLHVTDRETFLYQEDLEFIPNPALSYNTNYLGMAHLVWNNPGITAECWDRKTVMPDGKVLVEAVHKYLSKEGTFYYKWFDEECNEQNTLIYDEFTPAPPEYCQQQGGGGGEEDSPTSSPDPNGNIEDWSFLCDDLNLDPGDWDIYIDDVYNSTIHCD